MITVVTSYIPIPDHPRSGETYHKLGQQLKQIRHELMDFEFELRDCWLARFLAWRGKSFHCASADNPEKNTLGYHVVQAQKTELLWYAAMANPMPDVFCWIDYGIFSIPGVTVDLIERFLDRAKAEKAIAIPGCWGPDYTYDHMQPCWRWCGGVMIVPRKYVLPLDVAMKQEYMSYIETYNLVSWEVNTLARVERQKHSHLPLWHYMADHDASMFTNYQGAAHDGTERGNDAVM